MSSDVNFDNHPKWTTVSMWICAIVCFIVFVMPPLVAFYVYWNNECPNGSRIEVNAILVNVTYGHGAYEQDMVIDYYEYVINNITFNESITCWNDPGNKYWCPNQINSTIPFHYCSSDITTNFSAASQPELIRGSFNEAFSQATKQGDSTGAIYFILIDGSVWMSIAAAAIIFTTILIWRWIKKKCKNEDTKGLRDLDLNDSRTKIEI